MKISDYMPHLYKNNIEMNHIMRSEENEFETHIKFNIDGGFADNFIKTATIHGIEKYEELLDIKHNNSIPLEERRENVIVKLLASIPYTIEKLREILNGMLGEDSYFIEQDINNYTMQIILDELDPTRDLLLRELLKRIIPANIDWILANYTIFGHTTYFGVAMYSGEYETFKMKGV